MSKPARAKHSVSVRMYNVGFGDCFLLSIDGPGGTRRVLIDCGTHPSSTGPRRASDAVPVLIDDLSQGGATPRIDVVIATHRHKDHVSGFELRELWDTVEVGEVWMPWTENDKDPEAVNLLERMSVAALALAESGLRMRGVKEAPMVDLAVEIVANSLTNESAMATLHGGFAGKPVRRYLSTATEALKVDDLPGVLVHVLGPSRNEAVIRDLDPPKPESWMHIAEEAPTTERRQMPFDPGWAIPWREFMVNPLFKHLKLSGQIKGEIRAAAADQLVLAAAALEKSVNGTSLMLLFEIGDLLLLFPGDAQWGTWKAVLDDVARRAQLSRIDFYKVGHHGSHNATPRTFVKEVLPSGGWAALPFAKVERWPSIPQGDLIAAISGKAQLLRADAFPPEGSIAEVTVREDVSVELRLTPPA